MSVSAKLPPEAMFADEALLIDAAAVTQGKIVGDSKNFNAKYARKPVGLDGDTLASALAVGHASSVNAASNH